MSISNLPFPLAGIADLVDDTFEEGRDSGAATPGATRDGIGLKPCNLKLPRGCYAITMARHQMPFPLGNDFVGTMRVENAVDANGNDTHIISGDLYRSRVKLPLKLPERPPRNIPVYPRSRYHSYLKVIGIRTPSRAPIGRKCTLSLSIDEFVYTPPTTAATHGSFPSTASRRLTVVLERVPPLSATEGPHFVGKVFQGTTELPVTFTMSRVSKYYRRASLELESAGNAVIPAAAGTNNFRTIYATAGWDLSVVNGDTNLPIPAGVSSTNPWSNAELHAFMVANRNAGVNLDAAWRYYYTAVPHDSEFGGIFGIMFDQIGDHREGSCNFVDNMTGNFGDAFSKLRSAAHEIGHGFNQLHPQNEDPELERENFIMTQSGDTRSAILNNGGTYPDDIRFEFSPHHEHHLVHAPDIVVRPGGEDFGFGHSDVLPSSSSPEDFDTAKDLGLELEATAVRSHIKLGEPLQLTVRLRNRGKQDVEIPQTLGWVGMNTTVAVGRTGDDMRRISSFAHVCDSTGSRSLKAGDTVTNVERVFWDPDGFVFTQPGVHKVEVHMRWRSGDDGVALRAHEYVWVDYPVTAKENDAAAQLMHPEVGKYVALGGNAVHLDTAVERIARAQTLDKDHPGLDCIRQMDVAGHERKKASGRGAQSRPARAGRAQPARASKASRRSR
jgi:hypothetical protein